MHLPGPLRAAVGLAATAAEELKNIPDRAVELPMLAVSTALQLSLRAQQRYARLAARGEQVLNREQPSEEPPPWATFDEPVSVEELRRAALAQLDSLVDGDSSASDESLAGLLGSDERGGSDGNGATGRSAGSMLEDLLGVSDPAAGGPSENDTGDTGGTVTPITRAPGAAGKSGAAPRKSARKTPRKTATRKTPTKAAPVTTAEKPPASRTPSKAPSKAPRKAADEKPGKQINKPRHTAPSKFDDADDS